MARPAHKAAIVAGFLVCVGGFLSASVDRTIRIEPDQPLIALMDHLWLSRAQAGAAEAIVDLGDRAVRVSPRSYGVHWRVARAQWWISHLDGANQERRNAAKASMDWARRAIEHAPSRVEGHYYHAMATGEYATLIGIPTAVLEGVAGKIEGSARRAYAVDPEYDDGGPMIFLGRFYYMLPWPKRDLEQSVRYLEESRQRLPSILVGRLFLAETYQAMGDEEAARRELDYVLAAPTVAPTPGVPRAKELAQDRLQEWFAGSRS